MNTNFSAVSVINKFVFYNFLGTVTDAVHSAYSCHLVSCLHVLCHTLSSFDLLDDKFKMDLCLFVQIYQICSRFTAKAQIIEADRIMFLDIIIGHISPMTNESVFLQ